jgi:aminoglycoside 3-N-acetyltransferase
MSEGEVVERTETPATRESLAQDLYALGVRPGMTLIMHSSLRSLGWVCGGPVAVVQALMDIVTEEGTIVMPTHTGNYSDPATWSNPPVPQEWWEILYEAMPAFNPDVTPTYMMGAIVEVFRTYPGVLRSNHPQVSFAAWGKRAKEIIDQHSLENGLGEQSPLARIYDLHGYVLLLGVGYDNNTSFHLAEYRAPGAKEVMLGAPIFEDGQRVWKRFRDIEFDSDIFPEIGLELERTKMVTIGNVGLAECRFFPQQPAIDFAVQWYKEKQGILPPDVATH